MGLILAKFRRKTTTLQFLESLDKDIKYIEEFQKNTEKTQKLIIGRLLLLSIAIYVLCVILSYLYFFPKTVQQGLIYLSLLIFTPILIILLKRVLTWYYSKKISNKENKLLKLRAEKIKTLDMVMENETYKVAKTILEKFAPEQIRKPYGLSTELMSTPNRQSDFSKPGARQQTAMRKRIIGSNMASAGPTTSLAVNNNLVAYATSTPVPSDTEKRLVGTSFGSAALTSRTIIPVTGKNMLPRERSILDKMVEYLMGDGPTNRYALICSHCSSHNGMALKEEFEYISFKCYYCYTHNTARKRRPQAPVLDFELTQTPAIRERSNSTSESEKNSVSSVEDQVDDINDDKNEPDLPVRTLYTNKKEFKSDEDKLSEVEFECSKTSEVTEEDHEVKE